MKVKVALAAVAAGLLLTAGSCQSTESDDGCHWELESIAYSKPVPKPRPQAPPRVVKVPGARPPVKMPTVKPHKPTKAPKGKVWEYDCD